MTDLRVSSMPPTASPAPVPDFVSIPKLTDGQILDRLKRATVVLVSDPEQAFTILCAPSNEWAVKFGGSTS